MEYFSTNNKENRVSLKEAVLKGLANDKGLYMPVKFGKLSDDFIKNIEKYSFQEIAFEVAKAIFQDDIPENDLKTLVYESLNFDVPLVSLDENTHVLELWHGPTMAFKDVGARFMARLLGYLSKNTNIKTNVLVATSGDTGSAVANGFYNVPGISVTILYPKGGVSKIQEMQLTTLGGNITAVEIDGVFDDCQRLVKEAFLDDELNKKLTLTSANSINVARLFPQSFYYFYAYAQLKDKTRPVVFSVPSGNYGNITAGLIAKHLGLPIERFIASSNDNNVVPEYLETSVYRPRPSVATISNAMDVGDPSNFVRITELYHYNIDAIRRDIVGFFFNDDETRDAMKEVYEKYHYVLDSHGSVAYNGLKSFSKLNKGYNGIILETAHPAKFMDIVNETLSIEVEIPKRLAECMHRKAEKTSMNKNFDSFKSFLINKYAK